MSGRSIARVALAIFVLLMVQQTVIIALADRRGPP